MSIEPMSPINISSIVSESPLTLDCFQLCISDKKIRSQTYSKNSQKINNNMAIIGFDEKTKRMKVLSINPGFSRQDVQDNCGFELLWSEVLSDTEPPHADELRILREEVDPYRYVIGR